MLSIAFIADKNFVVPTVVAITSLLENKKNSTDYKIYLFSVGIESDDKLQIEEVGKRYQTEISIVEIDEEALKKKYSKLEEHECCANISALIKFDLPEYCREERVLYLDGDLIVRGDLSELENLAFDNDEYAATVPESGLLYNKVIINQNVDNYFNSGVMLLNLAAMRKDSVSQKLVFEKINSKDNSLMDQHVFNKVFCDRKICLKHKYNVLYTSIIRASYFHGITINQINGLYGTDYSDFDDILNNSVIVHYSTFDKPWKYSDIDAVEEWNKYYNKSIFSGKKIKRKKLHIKLINKMRRHKFLGLFATFLWECETRGLKKAFNEVKKYMSKKA